ncbi:hypothetical protein FJZ17_02960, partial [Candidatus Pacearchaeota archaeon]|nr:hypothetical protein [Candidatus Pacearchaeota archaeon]
MQKKSGFFKFSRKAQLAIFVIVAIIIVAGIVGFFVFRNNSFGAIPKSIQPVQDYYSSCIKNLLLDGANFAGSRGGYIESPEFIPGNVYAPFSSELDFMGTGVPYWYYISSSGVVKEQVPSKKQIEKQFNNYLKERASICNFDSFTDQGYQI